MKVGFYGVGRLGLPLAQRINDLGFEVTSWSRNVRELPWTHMVDVTRFNEHKFDVIVLACSPLLPKKGFVEHELELIKSILPEKLSAKNTRIIYLSSVAVYGECNYPKGEKALEIPSTPYGIGKLRTENYLRKRFDDSLKVLRIGNVVDWQNPDGLVKSLTISARQSTSFTFYGFKDSCRDYLSIDLFLESAMRVIQHESYPSTINVGSGKSVQLQEIETVLIEQLGEFVAPLWLPHRPEDVRYSRLSSALLKTLLPDNHLIQEDFLDSLSNFLFRARDKFTD